MDSDERRSGSCATVIAANTKTIPSDLQRAHDFAEREGSDDDREYGFEATDDDRAGGFKMLQSGKVKSEGSQHRQQREQQQEKPLRTRNTGLP